MARSSHCWCLLGTVEFRMVVPIRMCLHSLQVGIRPHNCTQALHSRDKEPPPRLHLQQSHRCEICTHCSSFYLILSATHHSELSLKGSVEELQGRRRGDVPASTFEGCCGAGGGSASHGLRQSSPHLGRCQTSPLVGCKVKL